MKLPEMHGFEVEGLIGYGESGKVFVAKKDECGQLYAVKVFEGMAINKGLLSRMTERLEEGGWPQGVMKLDSADFSGRPACWVAPYFGEKEDNGSGKPVWKPRSLQHRLDEYPDEGAWDLLKEIAVALAGMHRRRVAHGNLKPGNVFFDDEGGVALSDWVLGNMPGIAHFEYTDALLYQPPEQLLDAGGYFEEEGYGWDVFAFGVLSFRLLTGRFPRCHESFMKAAPASGETRVEGMQADVEKIVGHIKAWDEVAWPTNAKDAVERGYRGVIERCLMLERAKRPTTMMEVAGEFERIVREVEMAEERGRLMNERRHAAWRVRGLGFAVGLLSLGCLVAVVLWNFSKDQVGREKRERVEEKRRMEGELLEAKTSREKAEAKASDAVRVMEYERELGLARLEASRMIGDRLFEWAMEKGPRRLPALEGRELRLKRLEGFFEEFLRWSEGNDRLVEERAIAKLQLAEVSLAAGDVEKGEVRLNEALGVYEGYDVDGEMKLRMGRDVLLLAMLKQDRDAGDTGEAYEKARLQLAKVPEEGVNPQRLAYLRAVLDFNEARILAGKGEDGAALERLLDATKVLNRLADARPDSAILRSELAECYLSSASILEGMGKVGDAREVRELAVAGLLEMLKTNAGDTGLMLELAGCYGAMAEAAVLAGDVGAGEKFSGEAMKLLDQVLQVTPESVIAVTRKAAQMGLQAGLLRDRGDEKKSLDAYEGAIQIIERLGMKKDGMASYRLALLWWQKGRMLGYGEGKEEELKMLEKARGLLSELAAKGGVDGLRSEDLQRSAAYLTGDYGHALDLAGRKEDAKKVYAEAVQLWESLLKSRPQSEEYQEGLEWVKQSMGG